MSDKTPAQTTTLLENYKVDYQQGDMEGVWAIVSLITTRDARIAELETENARLREALTPSLNTKAAFMGEFAIDVVEQVNGHEKLRKVQIPWTSIKEVMAAITSRAALSPEPPESEA